MYVVLLELREPGNTDDDGQQVVQTDVFGDPDWTEEQCDSWVSRLQDSGVFPDTKFIITKVAHPFDVLKEPESPVVAARPPFSEPLTPAQPKRGGLFMDADGAFQSPEAETAWNELHGR